ASLFGASKEFDLTPPNTLAEELAEPDLSAYHVLLVDDNMINIEVATAILNRTIINITCASDGGEAIDALKFNEGPPIDIV
ncbi:hypothetical protein V6248_19645, partial [Pseudoalteromonas agarivorans]